LVLILDKYRAWVVRRRVSGQGCVARIVPFGWGMIHAYHQVQSSYWIDLSVERKYPNHHKWGEPVEYHKAKHQVLAVINDIIKDFMTVALFVELGI
jgi:hypothetical protein